MIVGGEFYEDEKFREDHPSLATGGMTFLAGGQSCLRVIARYLRARGIEQIWLPEYLCPTILSVLEGEGLICDFYRVNQDLCIDLEHLARLKTGCQALLFINYFGFERSIEEKQVLKDLQRRGTLLVEDNAQAGFVQHPLGDFVFNSLRKLCPHDGGYLSTDHDITPFLPQQQSESSPRLALIRAYRQNLRAYLLEGKGEHAELDRMFHQAEQVYTDQPALLGDAQEKVAIEKMDWQAIKRVRRENFQVLLRLVASIPEITPIYPELQPDNLPLGLPVYLNGVSRDRVIALLGEEEIGLTVHWDALLDHPRTCRNPRVVQMASRMVTLAIDQRHSRKQLEYQALNLVRAIEDARA